MIILWFVIFVFFGAIALYAAMLLCKLLQAKYLQWSVSREPKPPSASGTIVSVSPEPPAPSSFACRHFDDGKAVLYLWHKPGDIKAKLVRVLDDVSPQIVNWTFDGTLQKDEAIDMAVTKVKQFLNDAGEAKPTSEKPAKQPSVTCGKVVRFGYAPRSDDTDAKRVFCLVLATDEGETTLWGRDLETGLKQAHVKDGDRVEVVKAGRRIVDPKKAPMNIFLISKIEEESVAS